MLQKIHLTGKQVILYFVIFFSITSLIFYSYQRKFNFDYQRDSDKWGYTVYLPAFFIYDFKAENFPAEITKKTFTRFEFREGKVYTQYAIGTAYLQAPFWLIAHAFAEKKDGFSDPYIYWLDISAIFYAYLAILLIYKTLRIRFDRTISFVVSVLFFVSTNLLFYTLMEVCMSHSYSFFCNALLIYCLENYRRNQKVKYFYGAVFAFALVVIIRQLDVVFSGIIVLGYLISEYQLLLKNLKFINLLIALMIGLLLYLPQSMYYLYFWNKFYYNTYGNSNQGFDYALNPRFLEVYFSPKLGQFIHYPITFLFLIGIYFMPKTEKIQKISVFLMFLVFGYFYGAYITYNLGYTVGYRTFVNVLPFFAIPFAYLLHKAITEKKNYVAILIVIFTVIGLKITLTTNGIANVEDWDWKAYKTLLTATKRIQ